MRKWILVILVLVMSLGSASRALAGDRAANGLFFGAGSGALIGQAIGRNTDATLLGAAVGGVLGYIVGNEQEKAYARGPVYSYRYPGPVYTERRVVVRRPAVIYRAAPPVFYYRDYRWNRHHRDWRGHEQGWTRHYRGRHGGPYRHR